MGKGGGVQQGALIDSSLWDPCRQNPCIFLELHHAANEKHDFKLVKTYEGVRRSYKMAATKVLMSY